MPVSPNTPIKFRIAFVGTPRGFKDFLEMHTTYDLVYSIEYIHVTSVERTRGTYFHSLVRHWTAHQMNAREESEIINAIVLRTRPL